MANGPVLALNWNKICEYLSITIYISSSLCIATSNHKYYANNSVYQKSYDYI